MTTSRIPTLTLPALALALAAVLATSACGSADADTPPPAGGSTSQPAATQVADDVDTDSDSDSDADEDVVMPAACSLLTADDIKAVTGATYSAGTGTDYDNSCRFDTSSDRIVVNITEVDGLAMAEPIGIEVVPVDGLPGATRVDAVVYVDLDGYWLSVSTSLPGFAASERDATAAEELAKIAVSRL